MKKALFLFLCIVFCASVSAQNLNKAEVDRFVDLYTYQEKYDSVSLMLVSFANQEHQKGNLETALEYQIKNCELIEKHIDSFVAYGITLNELYANYGMVLVLQRDLNRSIDAINTYLELAQTIKLYSPNELPFYTSLIASSLGECTTMPWADSVYCLQDALEIIKLQDVTKDNIEKYLWYCRCFNMNRMYNSFEDKLFVHNRIGEIESWYSHNNSFILELDSVIYKREILEYLFDYADILFLFAGAVGAQNQDLLGANELYGKEIAFLSSVEIGDDLKDLKIASCHARIANNYYQLGNLSLCKQYCDKVFPYILNPIDNLEYCDLLNSLSNSYYNLNQSNLAAKLKFDEIKIREEIEGSVSLTDWSMYFGYIVDSNPNEVVAQNKNLGNIRLSIGGNANYYMCLGKAYSMLMGTNENYRDTAEMYFNKVDSVLLANNDYYEKYNLKNNTIANLYEALAAHYSRLGLWEKSYGFSKLALEYYPADKYYSYYKVALKAALLCDKAGIKEYLPRYYYGMEDELCKMLPTLGSVESDVYLGNGDKSLYHIPEWASLNPTDSVCVSIAYDAALLMKGLTLRYNVLTPYYESHPELIIAKRELDWMRDSIYTIPDENSRVLALHRYELKEREVLKEVNDELDNIHWNDVANQLKDDEACVEFVKYTADAYSWSDSVPRPHYAALVLQHKAPAPVFVDLFDEDELMDMYNLQPKSYDNEIGLTLYSKIWGKLEQYIDGNDKVFFSPMGLLNLINVELLTDGTGMTAAERFNLYRVSSTRNLLTRDDNRDFHSVAMFGGVDYEKAQEYNEMLISMNIRGNWAYLQNTLLEVEQINDLLKGSGIDVATLTGSFATEGAFKQLDGTQANVVHIASHGYYIPQTQRTSVPYFSNSESTANIQDELFYSGLILSGGQKAWTGSTFKPDNNDGILTAYEISKLDLHNVNLVVLSACETGLGDNLFDGIFGLQRAFKKAGVSSILMSLWKIDDRATSEYMSLFYEKLVGGCSIHDAYISTVLSMKEKYPDANYWASFILLD